MNWKTEWKPLAWIVGIFLVLYFVPAGTDRFDTALLEAVHLARDYAREHVLLCLLPAFFIAGAIGVFVSQSSVMRYLGANAPKALAYAVAAVSGTILAVCSCTVLPLFAGIYRMGAGLGPACAFLYSGPAINILAIALTARVLGPELGIARAVGSILFSVVIGLSMHLIFRKEEQEKARIQATMPTPEATRPLWQTATYFALMVGILVFANWGAPKEESGSIWVTVFSVKWMITAILSAGLGLVLCLWFQVAAWKVIMGSIAIAIAAVLVPTLPIVPFAVGIIALSAITSTATGETKDWFDSSWRFAKQILPLLFAGVIVAGFLLGRPNHEGIIPARFIQMLVGTTPDAFLAATGFSGGVARIITALWPFLTNLFASFSGALMYFATLTEVPILQGLMARGMAQGPALALLLAGPALSLPNMLVIRGILGTKKTVVFISLVVTMATISGMIYGAFMGEI